MSKRRALMQRLFGIDAHKIDQLLKQLVEEFGVQGVEYKQADVVEFAQIDPDDLAPVILEAIRDMFDPMPENAEEIASNMAAILAEAVGELLAVAAPEAAAEEEIVAAMAEEDEATRAYREKDLELRARQVELLDALIEDQAQMTETMAQMVETFQKLAGVPGALGAVQDQLKAVNRQLKLTPKRTLRGLDHDDDVIEMAADATPAADDEEYEYNPVAGTKLRKGWKR